MIIRRDSLPRHPTEMYPAVKNSKPAAAVLMKVFQESNVLRPQLPLGASSQRRAGHGVGTLLGSLVSGTYRPQPPKRTWAKLPSGLTRPQNVGLWRVGQGPGGCVLRSWRCAPVREANPAQVIHETTEQRVWRTPFGVVDCLVRRHPSQDLLMGATPGGGVRAGLVPRAAGAG